MEDYSKITTTNVDLINSLEEKSSASRKFKLAAWRFYKKFSNTLIRLFSSKLSLAILYILYKQWIRFSHVPAFMNIALSITMTVTLVRQYILYLFVGFLILYPPFFILTSLFESSVNGFVVLFLPLYLFTIFTTLLLYCYIDGHKKNIKFTLFEAFLSCLKRLPAISVVFLLQIALNIESILLLILLAFSFSIIFSSGWENSVYFWTLVIFFTINTCVFIFMINILFTFSYFSSVLDKNGPIKSILVTISYIKNHIYQFVSYFGFLLIIMLFLIYHASLATFENGFIITIFWYYFISFFLAFVLRETYNGRERLEKAVKNPLFISNAVFISLLIIGLPSYMLAASLLNIGQPTFMNLISQEKETIVLKQGMSTFYNTQEGYTILYPNGWTIYPSDSKAVTFYTNYTGSTGGGIWVTITVSSIYKTQYSQMYYSTPGTVSNTDWQVKDVTTKVTNFILQGNEGVQYTYNKVGDKFNEFQTHYLIRKGDYGYDVAFITQNKDVEDENSKIFNIMINSFQFPESKH